MINEKIENMGQDCLFMAGVGKVEVFKKKGLETSKNITTKQCSEENWTVNIDQSIEGGLSKIILNASGAGVSILEFWNEVDGEGEKLFTIDLVSNEKNGVIDFLTLTTSGVTVSNPIDWDLVKSKKDQVKSIYWDNVEIFTVELEKINTYYGKTVLTSNTLVDSSLNISVSQEDVRAGAGAKLMSKFTHSSGMTLKLTDAMFKMDFLAHNVGGDIDIHGDLVKTKSLETDNDGKINLESVINPQKIVKGDSAPYVWVNKLGFDHYETYEIKYDNQGKIVPIQTDFGAKKEVCVKYIDTQENGENLKISANFVPDTLSAILTAPLFAGDGKSVSGATRVGTITIVIPRFMLNGTQDLSLTSTGAAQTTIEGSALAVKDMTTCNGDGYYAVINKVLLNTNWNDNWIYTSINPRSVVESGSYTVTAYAIREGAPQVVIDKKKVNMVAPRLYGKVYLKNLSWENQPTQGNKDHLFKSKSLNNFILEEGVIGCNKVFNICGANSIYINETNKGIGLKMPSHSIPEIYVYAINKEWNAYYTEGEGEESTKKPIYGIAVETTSGKKNLYYVKNKPTTSTTEDVYSDIECKSQMDNYKLKLEDNMYNIYQGGSKKEENVTPTSLITSKLIDKTLTPANDALDAFKWYLNNLYEDIFLTFEIDTTEERVVGNPFATYSRTYNKNTGKLTIGKIPDLNVTINLLYNSYFYYVDDDGNYIGDISFDTKGIPSGDYVNIIPVNL